VDKQAQTRTFQQLGDRRLRLRSLIPSVAQEIGVPVTRLERIQWLHRSLLSALEMMSDETGYGERHGARAVFAERSVVVRARLLATARALRFSGVGRSESPFENASANPAPAALAPELQEPYWLIVHFEEQVQTLCTLLFQIRPHWDIERNTAPTVQVKRTGDLN
jgi:hypothetical protein